MPALSQPKGPRGALTGRCTGDSGEVEGEDACESLRPTQAGPR